MSLNCRSLCSKVPHILDLVIDNKVDNLLLQETRLKRSDTAIISEIQEYNFEIFQDRSLREIDVGGGIAILLNNILKVKRVNSEKFASFELASCSF